MLERVDVLEDDLFLSACQNAYNMLDLNLGLISSRLGANKRDALYQCSMSSMEQQLLSLGFMEVSMKGISLVGGKVFALPNRICPLFLTGVGNMNSCKVSYLGAVLPQWSKIVELFNVPPIDKHTVIFTVKVNGYHIRMPVSETPEDLDFTKLNSNKATDSIYISPLNIMFSKSSISNMYNYLSTYKAQP